MASKNDPPLDEIQWRHPQFVMENGLHSNSILFYFAESPFFDRTSNNAVLMNQALYNVNMRPVISTREAFEARLKSMSGLEFLVAQEPAETGPGMGTGVWVIRKQTRKKRQAGEEDDITVHATYFVVGENVYMAPTFGDIMSSRIATISLSIGKLFDSASSIQKWTPARGHVYQTPAAPRTNAIESRAATPIPESVGKPAVQKSGRAAPDSRLAEESFAIHLKYGGDYMDENPITGKPGEFHFASTGRKDRLAVPQAGQAGALLPALNTKATENPLAKDGKTDKTPTKAGLPAKPKRRKSKGTTTPS
ncbi:Mediator of RNA polymerase II transcription subunit 6 [Pleurostoma richardsiae]|uniref:Mediator of RNA polymerase II transcription subunit 6 n=1 Tax=Pleurostoma richardsiae TaxID=41990 RepID=A0AA38VD59_9PEZI|nr:Mediator of RNA polymerase II transcription subunit 6 [Pleurostoma richardsiae]